MRARETLICGAIVLLVLGPATPAPARANDRRILVIAVTPSTVAGWRADPALAELLQGGASALLSTRTSADAGADPETRARAAFATLGAGARVGPDAAGAGLAESLVDETVLMAVSPGLQRPLAAAPVREAEELLRLPVPSLGVIDARADLSIVGRTRALLRGDDVLIVLSPVSAERDVHLGVIAMTGSGIPRGVLRSPSTRRDGVVTLHDVAPTILDLLGVEVPPSMDGRVVSIVSSTGSVEKIATLERAAVVALHARRPLTRGLLGLAMALSALAVVVVARGRGSRILSRAMVAAAAGPLALYIVGVFRPTTTAIAAIETGAFCIAIGAMTAGMERARALLAVLTLTALVPVADLFSGGALAVRSPLAFQIAGGGRFYGVDDGVLGVVVGSLVLAIGLMLDRTKDRRVIMVLGLWAAGTVWMLGSPWYGAKFGAALTAVPALGVLAARAAGRRFDARTLTAIAAAAVLSTMLLVVSDAVRDTSSQTHVARAAEGRGDLGATISRKIEATWRITVYNIWSRAILVFGFALYLLRRFARARWDVVLAHHGFRAALLASVVGAVCGILFNDEGVITATPIAMFAATATLTLTLDPSRPAPPVIEPSLQAGR